MKYSCQMIAIILSFTFGSVTKSNGQDLIMSTSRMDSIKVGGVNFVIKEGYFDKKGDLKEYLKRIYFFEINHEQSLGHREAGVYLFTITSSHTEGFIFILNGRKWKYYTLRDLRNLVSDISQYFSDNDVSDDGVIKYLEGISNAYKHNQTLR